MDSINVRVARRLLEIKAVFLALRSLLPGPAASRAPFTVITD